MPSPARTTISLIIIFATAVWTFWELGRNVAVATCDVQCQLGVTRALYVGLAAAFLLILAGTFVHQSASRLIYEGVAGKNSRISVLSKYLVGALLSCAIFSIAYYLSLQSLFGLLPIAEPLSPLFQVSIVNVLSEGWLAVTTVSFSIAGPVLLYSVRMSSHPSLKALNANAARQNAVRIFALIIYLGAIVAVYAMWFPPVSRGATTYQLQALLTWYIVPGSLFFSAILDLFEAKIDDIIAKLQIRLAGLE